jgi:hypothetical protein
VGLKFLLYFWWITAFSLVDSVVSQGSIVFVAARD